MVEVAGKIVGRIGEGLCVLVAIEVGDGDEQIAWMTQKLIGLRIFRNAAKHFDIDVKQVGGGILLVSNFTVASDTRRGRRPSLDGAASPGVAAGGFQGGAVVGPSPMESPLAGAASAVTVPPVAAPGPAASASELGAMNTQASNAPASATVGRVMVRSGILL